MYLVIVTVLNHLFWKAVKRRDQAQTEAFDEWVARQREASRWN